MKEINNTQEFYSLVKGKKPVLLDFYADWCGPCQSLLPIVEKLADKHGDKIEIVKVNIDKNPQLSQRFSVRSIPALFFIKEGEVVENAMGMQTESTLDSKIMQYLN